MTINNDETTICPNCKALNTVEFSFWNPSEWDTETEEVECECGCTYDVLCEVSEVEYYFKTKEPENVVLPKELAEDEPCHSKDPNQLNLL